MYELIIPAMRSEPCMQGLTAAVAMVASCARVGCSVPNQVKKTEPALAAALANAIDTAGYPAPKQSSLWRMPYLTGINVMAESCCKTTSVCAEKATVRIASCQSSDASCDNKA